MIAIPPPNVTGSLNALTTNQFAAMKAIGPDLVQLGDGGRLRAALANALLETRERLHVGQRVVPVVGVGEVDVVEVVGVGGSAPERQRHLLAGGGAGRIKGGRHIKYTDKPSIANLLVTLMDKMDVPVDHIGGSTGKLPLDTLSGV